MSINPSCESSARSDGRVAIVGLGACMPDAPTVPAFWQNILANHVAIGDVPPNRWDKGLYHRSDRKLMDRTYSAIGGFIRYDHFDARRFRIMPRSLHAIDDVQKLALIAVAEALGHAGYAVFKNDAEGKAFDRDRCAIIMGNTLGGEFVDRTSLRIWLPEIEAALRASAAAQNKSPEEIEAWVQAFVTHYAESLPRVTEDSMTGELPNCITGRIANVFDLCGPNFTTDAACASSMAALRAGVHGLQSHEYDMALIGGADRSMDPPSYVKFSRIGALSPDGSRPFDAGANGFVMGEGAGIVVLKRLEDAERDNDTIYSVICGIGAASDGRGKGMTAPNPKGQRLAIERAWANAQLPISSAGLIEAHGTSTPVGDQLEVEVLTTLLEEAGHAGAPIPMGSVKSMIGHLKSASGVASLIKTTLALHHGVLPPSANFKQAKPESPLHRGKLTVNTEARPWPESSGPRRAGISSFGFGGTNSHVVLEAYAQVSRASRATTTQSSSPRTVVPPTQNHAALAQAVVETFAHHTGYSEAELSLDHHLEADLGIDSIKQAEVMAILRERFGLAEESDTRLGELTTLQAIIDYVAAHSAPAPTPVHKVQAPDAPPAPKPATPAPAQGPRVLAFGGETLAQVLAQGAEAALQAPDLATLAAYDQAALGQCAVRVALVADSLEDAAGRLQDAAGKSPKLLAARGIFVATGEPLAKVAQTAFVFPGQGSQYLGMLEDLAAVYPIVQQTFDEADAVLTPLLGEPLSAIVWPQVRDDAADGRLRETQVCQPAMLTADVALTRLLGSLGITPHRVAGHSLGEYAAAVAAGMMSFADALYAVSARGREMADVRVDDPGKMAMVAADLTKVQDVLAHAHGYVIAANKNCHTQTVIAGGSDAVDEVLLKFAELGIEARQIPVSHAFHSAIVAPAAEPLRRVLDALTINAPTVPLCANVHADYYPHDRAAIIDLLAQQLASPVEFIGQIERLYQDNVRIFVEVGPKRALTGFVRNVLGTRNHRALASNHPKKPGHQHFLELIAALVVEGAPVGGALPAHPEPEHAQAALHAQAPAPRKAQASQEHDDGRDRVVVSGMAVALPHGEAITPLDGDAFAALLAGNNLIDSLSEAERQAMVDLNVVRFDKHGGRFVPINNQADVLHLAGRLGPVDLKDYGVDPAIEGALDVTGKLAIAMGIDALRDAGLPLVRRMRTTSTGSQLFDRWGLPPGIAERTGVILASAFPGFDAIAEQMATHHRAQLAGSKSEFDRKWLFRALPLGHAQLAQMVLAQGPNTQINAACASGSQALGLARDWIRLDRCDRVIVVTADDITQAESLPWFGAGFLAVGTASIETDVTRAAVPFGRERNGMILGSGAAAFVVEKEQCVRERGMVPLAELLAADYANSAFHGTRLEPKFIGQFLGSVLAQVGDRCQASPQALAHELVFMSHETYTPARGGSSAAEMEALRAVFGDQAPKVTIANTKGFTGHPMGASLEDAAAIKGLQRQNFAAVANLTDIDPAFEDLTFSRGGAVRARLAVRFAAGFGSQVAATAYRRRATQEARLVDRAAYLAWCSTLGMPASGGLRVVDRTLRVVDAEGLAPEALAIPSLQPTAADQPADALALAIEAQPAAQARVTEVVAAAGHREAPVVSQKLDAHDASAAAAAPKAPAPEASLAPSAILADLTALFAEQTGYETADLAPDHALEADLGIDSVKQAEIFAIMRERFALGADENFRLSDVQTLNDAVSYVSRFKTAPAPTAAAPEPESAPAPQSAAAQRPAPPAASAGPDLAAITRELVALFAEETGYAPEDLAPDLALEADLGIDSIKQAEIITQVRERYGLPQEPNLRLSEVDTLNALAAYIHGRLSAGPEPTPPAGRAPAPAPAELTPPAPAAEAPSAPVAAPAGHEALVAALRDIYAEHTGYEPADLMPEHDLEADLGVDSVKQAEIVAIVRARYNIGTDDAFRLGDVRTLNALADYIQSHLQPAAPTPAPAVAEALTPAPAASIETPASSNEAVVLQAENESFEARRVGLMPLLPAHVLTGAVPRGRIAFVGSWEGPGALAVRALLEADGAVCEPWPAAEGQAPVEAPTACVMVLEDFTAESDPFAPAMTLFAAMRAMAALPNAPAQVMVLSRQAAGFGLLKATDSKATVVQAAALGGLSGMVKSIAKEWPQCACRIIDVVGEGTALAPWDRVAQVARSLWGGVPESLAREVVAKLAGDQVHLSTLTRHQGAVRPKLRPLPTHGKVVATGGARGVTHALLMALSEVRPLDITILARTAPLDPAQSPLAGCDEQQAKAVAKDALQATGERVTPASVRNWIASLQARVTVWHNLQKLEAKGCRVRLLPCDVSDAEARTEAMAAIQADGRPVHLLLHGAGIEESRLLKDKDEAALARTLAPKAVALWHLLRGLSPHRTVTLGSIAGRFGNGGQVDYAAANEWMAALARTESLPVLNLAWTAWADVGMATRGSVGQVLRGLGVALLPQHKGVAMGSALIESDITGDLVVAGDLGSLCAPERPWPALFEHTETLVGEAGAQGVRLIVTCDPKRDRGLDDHRIDGVPYLPGVLGVELMLQAAQSVCPEPLHQLCDVDFKLPIKFFFDKPIALQVNVWVHTDHLALSICTERTAPSGAVQRKEHFSARAPLKAQPAPTLKTVPPLFFVAGSPPQSLDRDAIYARYFHGPSFQVLNSAPMLSDFYAQAPVMPPTQQWMRALSHAAMLTAPWLREAGFQAAGLWEMATRARMSLPSSIESLWLNPAAARNQAPVVVQVWPRSTDAAGTTYDVVTRSLDGPNQTPGTVLDVMQGYRSIVLRPSPAAERIPPARAPVVRRVLDDVYGASLQLDAVAPLLDACAEASLPLLLSPAERTHWATLSMPKRRLEWLAGRLVAKQLLMATWGLDGPMPGPEAISIVADASGAPHVEVLGRILGPHVPQLSVSHGAGRALAMVSWQPTLAVGVDVEEIAERVPAFGTTYFTAAEQARAAREAEPSRLFTAMWAVKEATGKALGLGTRLDYLSIEALPPEAPTTAQGPERWRVSATPQSEPMLAERNLHNAHVTVNDAGAIVEAHVILAAVDSSHASVRVTMTSPLTPRPQTSEKTLS